MTEKEFQRLRKAEKLRYDIQLLYDVAIAIRLNRPPKEDAFYKALRMIGDSLPEMFEQKANELEKELSEL